MFWVISVYFNIRNTLPKFCVFLLGHPVYMSLGFKRLITDFKECGMRAATGFMLSRQGFVSARFGYGI